MNNKIITIDGPAGSGKSTLAKLLAKNLKLLYVDTGAMYRALTYLALIKNISLEDEDSILDEAKKVKFEFEKSVEDIKSYTKVLMDGKDITHEIRSKEVGKSVSIVSKLSKIRKYLVGLQREAASSCPSVLEGRDTGSVVIPDAACKIFLTASVDERVNRRKKQLCENNLKSTKKEIKCEIKTRDKIDSSREDSPLIVPEGAHVIDTTSLSIMEVFEKISDLFEEKLNNQLKD